MKRVLVTGAGGQLGRSIQDVQPQYPEIEFLFTNRSTLDITKADDVAGIFRDFGPDYCINCAAFTGVDQAESSPEAAFAVNAGGVDNLVWACRKAGTVLIHISTDYVFDGKKATGYLPGDFPNPINVYGKSKLEGERIIQESLDRYHIVRTSWLYSRRHPPNFYLAILEKAQHQEELTVTDIQRGCPTLADNLAAHLLELVRSGQTEFGISHFTDGEEMTWYDFACRIIAENDLTSRVTVSRAENYRSFASRPANSVLSER